MKNIEQHLKLGMGKDPDIKEPHSRKTPQRSEIFKWFISVEKKSSNCCTMKNIVKCFKLGKKKDPNVKEAHVGKTQPMT